MKNQTVKAIALVSSFLKELHLERVLLVVLTFSLLLTANPIFGQDEKPVGQRVGEELHETSVNSERPKTTGEFLDEARGDVPLNERIGNITRDSKEAFQQFGEGITTSIQETAKELTGNKES